MKSQLCGVATRISFFIFFSQHLKMLKTIFRFLSSLLRAQKRKKIVLVVALLLVLIFILQLFKMQSFFMEDSNKIENLESGPVRILAWTFTNDPPRVTTMNRLRKAMAELNQQDGAFCRSNYGDGDDWKSLNCQFNMEPDSVSEADAVMFYMFNSAYNQTNLPKERPTNQIWVSFMQESPIYSAWKDQLKNLFNWTMSYRSDSDIWSPYGRKMKLKKPIKPEAPIIVGNVPLDEWINQKDKLLAGVISHCNTPSKRGKLIEKMNKSSGEIDVYGLCGNKKTECSLTDNYNKNCDNYWDKLSSQYKFFMAFENALCRDYVTEKFWRTLEVGMVPVAYGAGFYKADAPPGSYIDARNFESGEELMNFLMRVGNDKKRYAKYFEWRREYTVEQKWSRGYCNLCKAVRDHKIGRNRLVKTYQNLKAWWQSQPGSKEYVCEKAHEFNN